MKKFTLLLILSSLSGCIVVVPKLKECNLDQLIIEECRGTVQISEIPNNDQLEIKFIEQARNYDLCKEKYKALITTVENCNEGIREYNKKLETLIKEKGYSVVEELL